MEPENKVPETEYSGLSKYEKAALFEFMAIIGTVVTIIIILLTQ